MKNKYKILNFLITSCILLLMACHDEDPCLTCFDSFVTCKVNGKEWRSNCISNDPLFGCRAVGCYYYIKDNYSLNIRAINDNSNNRIGIDKIQCRLGQNKIDLRGFWFVNSLNIGNCAFLDSIDINYSNNLIINQIDTLNYIIIGNFSFRVYNLCGDTATKTDGYFKTKFIF